MNNEELVKAGWTLHNAATDKAPGGNVDKVMLASGVIMSPVKITDWGVESEITGDSDVVAYKLEPSVMKAALDSVTIESEPRYTATTDEGGIVLACAAQLATVITLYNNLITQDATPDGKINNPFFNPDGVIMKTAADAMITLVGDVDYLVEKNAELETINATQVDQARAIMMASKITPEMIDTILLSMSIDPDNYSYHVMIKSKHEAAIFNASTAMFANRLNKLCGTIEDGENWAESMLRRTDEAGVEAAKLNVLLIAEKKESANYRDYYNSLTSKLGDAEKALNTALITVADQAKQLEVFADIKDLVESMTNACVNNSVCAFEESRIDAEELQEIETNCAKLIQLTKGNH